MSVSSESLPESSRDLVRLLRAALAGHPLPPVADWQALLLHATWHGVDAFLYGAIACLPADRQPPPAVLACWRRQALAAAATAVRREAQTEALLSALAAAGICVVPLKGTWLAAHVYPEPSQRAMCDIDLLVPQPELPRARVVLAHLGYALHGNTASIEHDCDQTYTCPGQAWPLELHWQLGVAGQPPLHRPEIRGLWQRLVPETLLGVPVHTLCPEEHLVYLAYHVLHHRFQLPLRSYLDLVLLGRRIDTQARQASLQSIAAEWGMEHALPRVMALACDLLDQEARGTPAVPMSAAESAARAGALRIILDSSAQHALPAERTLLDFQNRGPLARAGLLLGRIFMPREFLRREYACARWRPGLPLAYFLRARDLLRRNAGSVRRTLQHDPALARQLDRTAARDRLLRWTLTPCLALLSQG
jgi:hypothetical protein